MQDDGKDASKTRTKSNKWSLCGVALKVVCELSNSEIAQKLNVSETVVRQRLFQARKSILDFLESGDIHE